MTGAFWRLRGRWHREAVTEGVSLPLRGRWLGEAETEGVSLPLRGRWQRTALTEGVREVAPRSGDGGS